MLCWSDQQMHQVLLGLTFGMLGVCCTMLNFLNDSNPAQVLNITDCKRA